MNGATRWDQVALATLTQNVATGLAFGSFGTLILAIEQEYGATRGASSLAVSGMVLTLSVAALALGRIIERVSLRHILMLGAIASAVAYAALSVAHGPVALLALYALLGLATAMLGVLPAMTLAGRWSAANVRGRALGIVNMPLLIMAMPLIVAPLLQAYDIRTIYLLLAGAMIAMLAPLTLVRDGVSRGGAPDAAASADAAGSSGLTRSPVFWVTSLAVGIVVGAGTMKLAHFVPLLLERGQTFEQANLLLAIAGGSGLLGSLLFGALADLRGGAFALAINALTQAVMWAVLLMPVSYPVLVLDAVIVGVCGGGVQAALGTLLIGRYGMKHFARVYGLMALATLPMLFGLTPLAGFLYDLTGTYFLPIGVVVLGLFAAGAMFVGLERTR